MAGLVGAGKSCRRTGKRFCFRKSGEGGGPKYATYLRNTDGSPAIRLGEGSGLSLSPDGKWALARLNVSPSPLLLYPTGVGEMQAVEERWTESHFGSFLAGRKAICLHRNRAGTRGSAVCGVARRCQGARDQRGGCRVGNRSVTGWAVRGDSWSRSEGVSVPGGGRRAEAGAGDAAGRNSNSLVCGWALAFCDGTRASSRAGFSRGCGHRTKNSWKPVEPADSAGIDTIGRVMMSADNKAYVYCYVRTLSDLYLVQGLK